MRKEATELLNNLEVDLQLLGYEELSSRVALLRGLLTPRQTLKKAEVESFKVCITKGGRTNEVKIDGEKSLLKFLELTRKNHHKQVMAWYDNLDAKEHIILPSFASRLDPKSREINNDRYAKALEAQGLDLKIQIQKL